MRKLVDKLEDRKVLFIMWKKLVLIIFSISISTNVYAFGEQALKGLFEPCFYGKDKKMTKFIDDIISKKNFQGSPISSMDGFEKVVKATMDEFPDYDFSKCTEAKEVDQKKLNKWQKKNLWFGVNGEMTEYAMKIHRNLVKVGVDTNSNNYYKEIDKQMRMQFPNYKWK